MIRVSKTRNVIFIGIPRCTSIYNDNKKSVTKCNGKCNDKICVSLGLFVQMDLL